MNASVVAISVLVLVFSVPFAYAEGETQAQVEICALTAEECLVKDYSYVSEPDNNVWVPIYKSPCRIGEQNFYEGTVLLGEEGKSKMSCRCVQSKCDWSEH